MLFSGCTQPENFLYTYKINTNTFHPIHGLFFGAFDVDISGDYGNGSAIIVGIVLILSSLVFNYGAELEGAKAG